MNKAIRPYARTRCEKVTGQLWSAASRHVSSHVHDELAQQIYNETTENPGSSLASFLEKLREATRC